MALSSTQVAPDLLMGLLIRYYVFLNFRRRSREGLARLWLAGRNGDTSTRCYSLRGFVLLSGNVNAISGGIFLVWPQGILCLIRTLQQRLQSIMFHQTQ